MLIKTDNGFLDRRDGTIFSIPYDNADSVAITAAKVMVNGDIAFTISNGPIEIVDLFSVCQTANDATASTLQYKSNPTSGTATTISGASSTLATASIGSTNATVRLAPTALSTAPTVIPSTSGGVSLGLDVANKIIVHAGTISIVVGVGSTTGTWKHYLRYRQFSPDTYVVAS